MKEKTTKQLMRVFFLIAFISLIGILWQWNGKNTSKVKVSGGSFSEGIVGAPRYINPVLAQSPSDKDMTMLIFGTLLHYDKYKNIVYDLADSLTVSDDKKTYNLKLKSNIFFHDGNRITTDDLIFTIEKIQDPLIKSPLFNKWEGINVEKVSNIEVKFILSQEYSDLENNLEIGILPKHLWKNIKSEDFIFSKLNEKPIGSGSYKVEEIKEKESGIPKYYLLEKYNKSSAYIEHIKIYFYENEEALTNAYRKGEIESAYGLSANKENHDLFENEFSSTGKLPRIFGLFFNQNKQKLLKNKEIRLLINNVINRQKIIDKVFAGYAYPIDNPIGETITNEKQYNDSDFTKFLQKNNWIKNKDGIYYNEKTKEVLSFTISAPNVDELIEIAEIVKESLLRYGIGITIKIFENSDFHEKVIRPRDYEILLFGYMIEKPTDLYAFWHSSQKNDPGFNISLYSNNKVDKELEKLRKDKNSSDIQILLDEINKDIPAVFIYSPAYTYLLPKKIKGENISITEKQDRFLDIRNWYIQTRSIWNIFIKKEA
jgi:peptide/nickel transport system substrate-binding protein